MYKRHYETSNSVYWICTLSNKYKCKQRVIAEIGKPFNVRFKGPGHNHSSFDYQQSYQKSSTVVEIKPSTAHERQNVKDDVASFSDLEW